MATPLKYTLELLKANHVDADGNSFTRECLENAAAGAQHLRVLESFEKTNYATIGHVDKLYMSGDALMAEISVYDTPQGKAAQDLLDNEKLELAASACVDPRAIEDRGTHKRIHGIELRDPALTGHKIK